MRERATAARRALTLADLDEVMQDPLNRLCTLLVDPYKETHVGLVFAGRAQANSDLWGPGVQLPSGETLQTLIMDNSRWPQNRVDDSAAKSDGDDVVVVATRVTRRPSADPAPSSPNTRSVRVSNSRGDAETADATIAVLFRRALFSRRGRDAPDGSTQAVGLDLHAKLHSVACTGIHIHPISVFSRHDPFALITNNEVSLEDGIFCNLDGRITIQPTTTSVFNTPSRSRADASDHEAQTTCASTGESAMLLAKVLLGTRPSLAWRPAHTRVAYEKYCKRASSQVRDMASSERGPGEVDESLTISTFLVELLSAERFAAFSAHPIFQLAFSDYLVGPSGMWLILAASAGLAREWRRFALPRPSLPDREANEQLRLVFESSNGPRVATRGQESFSAIDVALLLAARHVESMEGHSDDRARGHVSATVRGNLLMLQRVGQRVVSALFGPESPTTFVESVDSTPEQVVDRLDDAKRAHWCAKHSREDDGPFRFASKGRTRERFVRGMNAVEQWIRAGVGEEDKGGFSGTNPISGLVAKVCATAHGPLQTRDQLALATVARTGKPVGDRRV